MLSLSRGQAIFKVLKLRGQVQSQGLDLRGQGLGLQNVSSRPRTSSRSSPLPLTFLGRNCFSFLTSRRQFFSTKKVMVPYLICLMLFILFSHFGVVEYSTYTVHYVFQCSQRQLFSMKNLLS